VRELLDEQRALGVDDALLGNEARTPGEAVLPVADDACAGGAVGRRIRGQPASPGTVSANAACSGAPERATPAASVVTVPATELVPSPLAFASNDPGVRGSSEPPCAGNPRCARRAER
jgi:hypothetical protein